MDYDSMIRNVLQRTGREEIVMGLFDKLLKGASAAPVDPATLPSDLAELRKMRDKAKWDKTAPYERKICEVGVELYRQGKLVANPGDVNDVNTLLKEMESYIDSCHRYTHYTKDPAFELLLLETGYDMVCAFKEMQDKDPTVRFTYPSDFVKRVWSDLPGFYAEGKYCQRNTPAARKYLRMILTFQVRGEKNITNTDLLNLFEVIAPGQQGKDELRKWITMDYGLQALHVAQAQQKVINTPYENIQAWESLCQLNTDIISSGSAEEMLAEYQRGAEAGNPYAQYMLGKFYRWGRFVEKDFGKSLAWLQQSAQQRFYLGIDELTWLLTWPPEGSTKQQTAEYKRLYDAWIKRQEEVGKELKVKYANAFTGAFDGAADNITYGCAVPAAPEVTESAPAQSEEYQGRFGKDSESPFTLLQWPSTITGPHGVVYHLQYVGMNTADYRADTGEFTTLHLSDRGAMSARNSDGYFWW